MKIKDLIYRVPIEEIHGNPNAIVEQITFDSRSVKPNSCFVAISGTQVDGHEYIDKALQLGAQLIVCESLPKKIQTEITYIRVSDSRVALGIMAGNFHHNPTQKLKLIGITGTNGKTSCVFLMKELFDRMGIPSAMVSTVKIEINKTEIHSTHTTPDIVRLNEIFAQAVQEGCEYAFMEVSSHGVHQKRIAGLDFHIAGFTNISHDHLDYHGTFKNYLEAKKAFFDELKPQALAITNFDDRNGKIMTQNTKANVKGYALKMLADYKGKILENEFTGMLLDFNGVNFHSSMVGVFNAYNLLLVYAIACELGYDAQEILTQMSAIGKVPGRFQVSKSSGGVVIIVDYAHTPDALENVMNTINHIRTNNEKFTAIVGCGGNRDKEKRPFMAQVAVNNANQVILTSDNPRDEDPEKIIEEMTSGIGGEHFSKTLKITNREEAIKTALTLSQAGDIILIAGKGHETYQEIKGVKHPFNDYETAMHFAQILNK